MAKVKKAQLGDTVNFKRTIGDSVALKQKADSIGISTSKAKEALAKKIAAKKKAKDGKWIQKAVNPAHKGYCTPMTKATCTPKRKALAKTFKAIGKARKSK